MHMCVYVCTCVQRCACICNTHECGGRQGACICVCVFGGGGGAHTCACVCGCGREMWGGGGGYECNSADWFQFKSRDQPECCEVTLLTMPSLQTDASPMAEQVSEVLEQEVGQEVEPRLQPPAAQQQHRRPRNREDHPSLRVAISNDPRKDFEVNEVTQALRGLLGWIELQEEQEVLVTGTSVRFQCNTVQSQVPRSVFSATQYSPRHLGLFSVQHSTVPGTLVCLQCNTIQSQAPWSVFNATQYSRRHLGLFSVQHNTVQDNTV